MKIFLKTFAILSGIVVISLFSGCSSGEPDQAVAIANPASEHCVKKGGKLEIVKDATGEKGMCHLSDGTVVEEWELFRRDNSKE